MISGHTYRPNGLGAMDDNGNVPCGQCGLPGDVHAAGVTAPHRYISTACLHEGIGASPDLHRACRETCKFCDAPCACPRHVPGETLTATRAGWVGQARSIARELYEHAVNAGALPLDLVQRLDADPGLFWLRDGEQPSGTWRPA